jgi:glycosyltransferase involved in cell wall biosynthesis
MVAGRLLRSKGVGEFLEMARHLRSAGVTAQAVLVGPEERDNPDAFSPSVLRAAVRDGLVRWNGFREDVRTVYAASDVVVVTTQYAEGTPKGVMEGMAMARPVVCYDIPSTRALVAHGRDGMLVAPGRPAHLAGIVDALLRSLDKRTDLGSEARRRAVVQFDAERVAQLAIRNVYAAIPGWSLNGQSTT